MGLAYIFVGGSWRYGVGVYLRRPALEVATERIRGPDSIPTTARRYGAFEQLHSDQDPV